MTDPGKVDDLIDSETTTPSTTATVDPVAACNPHNGRTAHVDDAPPPDGER
ncbi:MAG: hypothetical protein INR71_07780 [Terriglobus roseus]|nr:hypothetical protein [Terriglobus roseus]